MIAGRWPGSFPILASEKNGEEEVPGFISFLNNRVLMINMLIGVEEGA